MGTFGRDDFTHYGLAFLAALPLGYLLSWALDRLALKRLLADRVAGIALSCALAFILLMGGSTLLLTRMWSFPGGPLVLPPLGYAVGFLLGLALVGAARMRSYGQEYLESDEQAVFEPDWNDLARYDEEVIAWDEKNAGRGYLRRHWAGHLSLPVSYWVNGALLSGGLLLATEFLGGRIRNDWGTLQGMAIVALAYLCLAILLWVWSSVGIWRSAYWHRRRGGAAGWGVAARALVLLSAAATVYRSEDIALQAAELGNLAVGRDSLGRAAEIRLSKNGRELTLRGALAAGSAERFKAALEGAPQAKTVVLSSPGGRMLEAQRIAELVRAARLDTRVEDICMSACTGILLAGRERTAPEDARIGFHQPSFPGTTQAEMRGAIDEARSAYLAAGVEPAFVWRAMSTPARSMWFPSHYELESAGVLTGSEIVVTGGGRRPGAPAQAASPPLGEGKLRQELQAAAARMNQSVPRRLDEVTTLIRASASGTTLTSHYRVDGETGDFDAARPEIANGLRDRACRIPEAAAALRSGARFVHSYESAGGRHLLDIAITDCPRG